LSSSGNKLDGKNPDYLATQIMQETALLQGAISKGTIGALRDCIVLSFIIAAMLIISYETLLIGLAIAVPLGYCIKKTMNKINYYTRQSQQLQLQISTRLLQTYQGLLTINSLRSQEREIADFQKLNLENYRVMKESLLVRTIFSPSMELFAVILLTGAFAYKFDSNFNAETYTALLILLAFSFRYLKNIANAVTQLSEIKIVISRIKSYFKDFSESSAKSNLISLSAGSPFALITKNISFISHDGKMLLENCSMQVERGKKVAFIGASGAGKTTFLRVVSGLIVPSDGQIEIEPSFILASQFPYLFKGTIKENIIYAHDIFPFERSEEKVKELLLALSLAYSQTGARIQAERQLGFLGEGLSGGEKARVALARALYADANLLLLDEPTANLDTTSSQLFWQAIDFWQGQNKKRTVIAISHATEELKGFDVYYTFENGKVIQTQENKLRG
ncbi:MAG: ABC transporter ATP-binding protein/permease, partial [Silvanigrellaceae bacterium]|nr:ABC transporter ATP-binding protein/permease [Silvanigrellaceae bacterium]